MYRCSFDRKVNVRAGGCLYKWVACSSFDHRVNLTQQLTVKREFYSSFDHKVDHRRANIYKRPRGSFDKVNLDAACS